MGIIKSTSQRLAEAQRENERLTAQLAKEKEKVQFLGLLAADVDIEELMADDAEEEEG